jgi:hypothetical protein
MPPALLWQLADPDNQAATVAAEVLSPLALVTTVGSLLVALFYTGVFGIDEPARRAFVRRVLRVSIAVVLAAAAVLAGVLTSLAGEIRRGLDLTWARVTLEPPGAKPQHVTEGTPAGEPAATVPLEYQSTTLGRIECGPRTDGPLLAEDRWPGWAGRSTWPAASSASRRSRTTCR